MRRLVLVPSILVMLSGCGARSQPPAGSPTPAAGQSQGEAPFRPSKSVRWVRDSAEHRAAFLQVYALLGRRVEEEGAKRPRGTWAVVLDADETVIDNSAYQVEREEKGLTFTRESWSAWTRRREAVPLPGARELLSRVRELGGRVAIVTNRRQSECPDTKKVFDAHDLAYDVILCRADDGPGDKEPRFEAVASGSTHAGLPPLEIVAFVGDNIHDFPGLDQETGARGGDAPSEFGSRFFVVPNPMYGSWE